MHSNRDEHYDVTATRRGDTVLASVCRAQCGRVLEDPVLLFLGVFVSLVFFFLGMSLLFLSDFCLFYRVLTGSHRGKILDVFEVFLGVFEKPRTRLVHTGVWRGF